MRVIYKKVGEAPRPLLIDGRLETMQNLVKGYIETVSLTEDVLMVCNEDGKFNGSKLNFGFRDDFIFGDVFFCGTEGEEFADCPMNAFEIKMMLEDEKWHGLNGFPG